MKVQIKFKNPDAIHEIINSRFPQADNQNADTTDADEEKIEAFCAEYFEHCDDGRIEIDTDALEARLLPRHDWQ